MPPPEFSASGSSALSVPDLDLSPWNSSFLLSTNTVEYCGNTPVWLIRKREGKIFQYKPLCQLWRCPNCGPNRAAILLSHLSTIWAPYDRIYFADVPAHEGSATKIRQILTTRRKRNGLPEGYLSIHRGNRVHVYAAQPYEGRASPIHDDWEGLDPQSALEKLSMSLNPLAMSLEDKPVTMSDNWGIPTARRSKTTSLRIGMGTEARAWEAWQRAWVRLSDTPPPDIPFDGPPPGISVEAWASALREEFDGLAETDVGEHP